MGGTPYTHPDYDPAAFYIRDVGVVVLDEPVQMDTYGQLPTQDQLDSLKPRRSTTFTSVGYGLQQSFPDAASWKNVAERVRMVANPQLLQINTGFTGDQSLLLSNNANTGGTSFGMNSTCAGTGGVMRVDRGYVLDWIYDTFGDHL